MSKEMAPLLLPEADEQVVQAFASRNKELGWPVRVETMSLEQAAQELLDGTVSGVIAGAAHKTADVILAGVKSFNPRRNATGELDPEGSRQLVSSYIVFEIPGGSDEDRVVLADPGVIPEPTAEEMVRIAADTVTSVKKLNIQPRLAFLSYSTLGSARGELAEKSQRAVALFKEAYPDVPVIGEVQLDAATDEAAYRKKTGQGFPGGQAPNVFIVDNLSFGNNLYKSWQSTRFGRGFTAIGPLLQGFENNRQWHDVSRAVSPEAFVKTVEYVLRLSAPAEQ